MKTILGVDFGENFLSIFKKDEGIIFKEPSLITVKKINNNYEVVSIGENAKKSEFTDNTITFSPIFEGGIKSVEYASLLLKYALNKIFKSLTFKNYTLVFAVPCGCNEEEINKYKKIANLSDIKKTNAIYVPLCLAKSLQLPKEKSFLILDIGAGKTDVAVVCGGEIIKGATLGLGGNNIDNLILNEFSSESIIITDSTAKSIKEQIGSLISNDKSIIDVIGLDTITQTPHPITINSSQIYPCVEQVFREIMRVASATLGECSTDLLNEILLSPAIIVGSCSNITGLEKYIETKLNMHCFIPENAENCIVKGIL